MYYNNIEKITGGFMAKLPAERGAGLIEWILIAVLILMVLVTAFLLLEPALVNLWQGMLQSIQE
jgi:Flp pilus assembly pilin Flp